MAPRPADFRASLGFRRFSTASVMSSSGDHVPSWDVKAAELREAYLGVLVGNEVVLTDGADLFRNPLPTDLSAFDQHNQKLSLPQRAIQSVPFRIKLREIATDSFTHVSRMMAVFAVDMQKSGPMSAKRPSRAVCPSPRYKYPPTPALDKAPAVGRSAGPCWLPRSSRTLFWSRRCRAGVKFMTRPGLRS